MNEGYQETYTVVGLAEPQFVAGVLDPDTAGVVQANASSTPFKFNFPFKARKIVVSCVTDDASIAVTDVYNMIVRVGGLTVGVVPSSTIISGISEPFVFENQNGYNWQTEQVSLTQAEGEFLPNPSEVSLAIIVKIYR